MDALANIEFTLLFKNVSMIERITVPEMVHSVCFRINWGIELVLKLRRMELQERFILCKVLATAVISYSLGLVSTEQ